MTTNSETGREMVGSEGKNKGKEIDTSRRNFTRLGAAAPVLMTLASRSALGQDCSPSAVASGNLSHNDTSNCMQGISGSSWVSRAHWPAQFERGTYEDKGTLLGHTRLGEVFGFGHPSTNKSLLQCLMEDGNGELGCCIAALLNGYDLGPSYPLNADQLLQMIKGIMPIPGGMGLAEYLRTTWV